MLSTKIDKLLEDKGALFNEDLIQRGFHDGIEVEKGIVLNEDYLEAHYDELCELFSIFTAYPDIFLDTIAPSDSNFNLFFYQRVVLRAIMRYRDIFVTAPRAFSKSFITILALILQCIFMPGTKRFICAPAKKQSAQIAKEKILEIYERWPLLRREVVGGDITDTPGNFGTDYVSLKFRNKSIFDVVGALDSQRGGRRQGGLIDEVRDHDEKPINEIVLPLLNVSRRLPDGTVNPKEPNQQRIFMTSSSSKTCFAYDIMLDIFEDAIIHPNDSFCLGCDYRVPMLHGLIDRTYINKLRASPSYNERSFAQEYCSIWEGASDDAWFNIDKAEKCRKLKNPELYAKYRGQPNVFYLLSVDVGRIHDQTVVCVFRVNISAEGRHYATLVNIRVLARQANTKTFTQQAIELKQMIQAYDPKEVVIDINGLGVGLGDEMIKEQVDDHGIFYPAYGFSNDDNYLLTQPKNAIKILYGIKANGALNSKIHSNVYARLSSGAVRLLIPEQEAKIALLATKVGQSMSPVQRVERLMPHEITSLLIQEMSNLRLKKTGTSTDITLERINERYPKDKYSAFAYGLYRIKEIEEAATARSQRRRGRDSSTGRRLVFYSDL